MIDDVGEDLRDVAGALSVVADRLVGALPAIGVVVADVERDWRDDGAREWAERASLVRRALLRELDATLAILRGVGDAIRMAGAEDDPAHQPFGSAGAGSGRQAARSGGPRLGGTEADRVDDERGVRIAELGADGGEPG